MNTQRTPGPWTDHGDMATLDGTPFVQSASAKRLVARMPGTTDTDEANARLIAAAPDLLAALKMHVTEDGHTADCYLKDSCTPRCRQTQAAIAKAELPA